MSKHQRGENNPNYKGNVVVCLTCGKEFKTPPSHNRKYCSKACYIKVQPRKLKQEGLKETLIELYLEQKLTTVEIGKSLECDPKTVTYWMDKFGIPRRTQSEILKANNPAKRPEVRKKISEAQKRRFQKASEREKLSKRTKKLWRNPDYRKRVTEGISKSLIGNKRRKGIPHSEETKRMIGETVKRNWKNPEYARKVVSALQESPNSCEEVVIRLIEENGFPFRYTGNRGVVIDGKVPDFIATDGSRRVIEVFGTPWHDPNHSDKIEVKYDRTEEGRTKFFARHGYDCLILWDDELGDEEAVIEKIRVFMLKKHKSLYEEVLIQSE